MTCCPLLFPAVPRDALPPPGEARGSGGGGALEPACLLVHLSTPDPTEQEEINGVWQSEWGAGGGTARMLQRGKWQWGLPRREVWQPHSCKEARPQDSMGL